MGVVGLWAEFHNEGLFVIIITIITVHFYSADIPMTIQPCNEEQHPHGLHNYAHTSFKIFTHADTQSYRRWFYHILVNEDQIPVADMNTVLGEDNRTQWVQTHADQYHGNNYAETEHIWQMHWKTKLKPEDWTMRDWPDGSSASWWHRWCSRR